MSIEDYNSMFISQVLEECIQKTENLNIQESKNNKEDEILVNRGTGAGGSNTNKNGLPYEELTELKSQYQILSSEKYYNTIGFFTGTISNIRTAH